MKREDIFGSDLQYIENWVQRIECLTGLECWRIRCLWKKPSFKRKELIEAFEKEKDWFKGLAQSIIDIC